MAEQDRFRWDELHAASEPIAVDDLGPPTAFVDLTHLLPESGTAVELACGQGGGAVWLARRGLDVRAVDVSPVAVAMARDLVARAGLTHRCRFEVADLDVGFPRGPEVDLVLCHLFNAPGLDRSMIDRLRPGGVAAVAVLSEVGAAPGRFRVEQGALLARFAAVDDIRVDHHGESDGVATLVATRR